MWFSISFILHEIFPDTPHLEICFFCQCREILSHSPFKHCLNPIRSSLSEIANWHITAFHLHSTHINLGFYFAWSYYSHSSSLLVTDGWSFGLCFASGELLLWRHLCRSDCFLCEYSMWPPTWLHHFCKRLLLSFCMLFWHFHHSVSPLLPSFLNTYFLNSIQDSLQLEALFDTGPIQHVPMTILEFVLWVPMTSAGTEQVSEFLQCNWKPHQEEAIAEPKRSRELDWWNDRIKGGYLSTGSLYHSRKSL